MNASHHAPPFTSKLTDEVLALLQSRPGEWIDVRELAQVGGFAGWRSRIAQARLRLEAEEAGTIQWNENARASAYRFIAHVPLGADPSQYREQRLF